MYSENDWRNYSELYHHGILGQRWGKRNGPPYPLDASDHSTVEKKAGWRKSLTNEKESAKTLISESLGKNLVSSHQKYGMDLVSIAAVGAAGLAVSLASNGIQAAKNKKEDKLFYEKRAKQREESGEKIDEATGFYKKAKQSTRQEDIDAVNPDYKLGGYGASNNCMLCTITYDLRRRGYDVEARKMAGNGLDANALKRYYEKPEINRVSRKDSETNKLSKDYNVNQRNMINNARSDLVKQGDGARGNIMVMWRGYQAGGHSMAYEINHGSLEIIDTQINKIYRGSEIDKLLYQTTDIQYARLDNVNIRPKNLKGVCR